MPPSLSNPPAPAYRWTPARAARGFFDWLSERARRPAGAAPASSTPTSNMDLFKVLLGSAAVLLVAWAAAIQLAPSLARLAGPAGPTGLAWGAAVLLALTLAWGARGCYRGGKRLVRFVQVMGYRGWELETGRRVPIRSVL